MGKNFKHTITLVRRRINFLVAQNALGEAADLLQELSEICDEKADEVIVLKRGISELEQERCLGKIGFKEASEIKNELADRLLRIAKSLFDADNRQEPIDPFPPSPAPSNPYSPAPPLIGKTATQSYPFPQNHSSTLVNLLE